MTFTVN